MSSLAYEVRGHGPTLVLAHGFTQTGRLWGRFGDLLAEHHRLICVDLPGHGDSASLVATPAEGGDLLVEAAGKEPFDLLGYSLGARFALQAALGHPEQIRRLVLIGASSGVADPAARRTADESLADSITDVGEFIGRWLAAPMFAGFVTPTPHERLRNTAEGLASSLRLAGAGTVTADVARVSAPTLVVAGARDVRFTDAGRRLVGSIGESVLSLIPGAGHAAHLDQPDLTAAVVGSFLNHRQSPTAKRVPATS